MPKYTDTASVIRRIESNGDYQALRFERGAFNAITRIGQNDIVKKIRRIHVCSLDTARMIYSTSWGAYQIMGFNLWGSLDYGDTYYSYLEHTSLQDATFQNFLIMHGINYTPQDLLDKETRQKFAKVYNGSIAYADKIKRYL